MIYASEQYLYFSEFHTLIFDATAKFTLCGLATSGLTLRAEKITGVETSPNLIWSFEDKAKLPNLLDKKEFNYRAFYPIRPKLDHNVNQ